MAERDPAGIPILATKLFIPQVRQSLVSRPRLIERLNAGLRNQLILICAPAGFGKTTVVSSWVRSLDGRHDPDSPGRPQTLHVRPHPNVPVAWLSLDQGDNDPTRFLLYLVAALQHISPEIGRETQATLEASAAPPPSVSAVVGALINDLASLASVSSLDLASLPALADHAADFLLVLDDFHTVDDVAIHEAIQTLVAHQPPHMHLVIVTREDPPLPLARLRALGQLTELRADDLRFSPEETGFFLREVMGLALEARDIQELDARIEGWIAGLQLAALSMQHRPDPAGLIADLGGTHHFIISYLTEEVLRHLSPDVRSFLLQTSVLTRLTGPLCDAVTRRVDGEAMLQHLYTSNAFVIPLDERHEWYRYHHLFAEMLLSQLRRIQPGLVPALHARACDWYEAQGMIAEAIEQAFAAEDYGTVVRLLEEHARPITCRGTLGRWATGSSGCPNSGASADHEPTWPLAGPCCC